MRVTANATVSWVIDQVEAAGYNSYYKRTDKFGKEIYTLAQYSACDGCGELSEHGGAMEIEKNPENDPAIFFWLDGSDGLDEVQQNEVVGFSDDGEEFCEWCPGEEPQDSSHTGFDNGSQ